MSHLGHHTFAHGLLTPEASPIMSRRNAHSRARSPRGRSPGGQSEPEDDSIDGGKIPCPEAGCTRSFKSLQTLRNHRDVVHAHAGWVSQCRICGFHQQYSRNHKNMVGRHMREEHHIRGRASHFCLCRPPTEEPWILTPDKMMIAPDMMVIAPAGVSSPDLPRALSPMDSDFTPDSEAGVNSFEWPTDIDADLQLLDSQEQPPLLSAAAAAAAVPVITIDLYDVDAINSLAVTLQSCMEHQTQ